MLVQVDAMGNSNKFYHLTDEGTTVIARWGRVGSKGVITKYPGGEKKFESILREKKRKGYVETNVVSSSVDLSTGKGNISLNSNVSMAANRELVGDKTDSRIASLVKHLVQANRHDIVRASGDVLSVDLNGVVSTPLGIISRDQIVAASTLLKDIGKDPKNVTAYQVNQYLSLVPQKVPGRGKWYETFFTTHTTVDAQQNLLTQLMSSYDWAEKQKELAMNDPRATATADSYENIFRYNVDILDDKKTFSTIERLFSGSRNSRDHANASRAKLNTVYTIADVKGDVAYQKALAAMGNERQLWHGTKAFNVLSILSGGLKIPGTENNNLIVTGSLFGKGIYLSDQSTKSLNYSLGYAPGQVGGTAGSERRFFMFLTDTAMGFEFRPNDHGFGSGFNSRALSMARTGKDRTHNRRFNSISVKGGTCGVRNNEMVVWNTDQVNLRYLCEFSV